MIQRVRIKKITVYFCVVVVCVQLVETTTTTMSSLVKNAQFWISFLLLFLYRCREEKARDCVATAHREKLKSFYSDKLRKPGDDGNDGKGNEIQLGFMRPYKSFASRWIMPQRFPRIFRAWRQFEDFSAVASLNCGHFRRCFKSSHTTENVAAANLYHQKFQATAIICRLLIHFVPAASKTWINYHFISRISVRGNGLEMPVTLAYLNSLSI